MAFVASAVLLGVGEEEGRAYVGPTGVESPASETPPRSPQRDEAAAGPRTGPVAGPDGPPNAHPRRAEDGKRERRPVRNVRVKPRRAPPSEPGRASSIVTRQDIDEMLPRSAPDALRNEPGVYVQQTAHAQASPYVRGLTGQQTVMFFDGVRLNNSTFRQGPNQYFFTIDARTIQQLEVIRGSASTRYGSDALGGALLSTPIEPSMDTGDRPVVVHGRAIARTSTADAEKGGRAQLDLSHKGKLGFFGGVGYRDVGQLRSGGRVREPATGEPQKVPPVFEDDDKTQRGTGFGELTADARLVWQPTKRHRWTLAYYDYRQYDAPRTDKCPPPTAPQDECLKYDEQFRTLAYGKYETRHGPAAARDVSVVLSYQRQHEDRELRRGSPSASLLDGIDDVHSVGAALRLRTKDFELAPWLDLALAYGADAYFDRIHSRASIVYTDVDISDPLSRGQYLDKADYVTSGAWSELQTRLGDHVRLRGGGRFAAVHAEADGDPDSESASVDRTWLAGVGSGGIVAQAVPWLAFVFNVDQGFRAPNLDDLTSRQQTGPGFQFENADLRPERSLSLEGGMQIRHPVVEVDAYVFQTIVEDMIQRAPRTVEQCPMGDPGCGASQTRFQLVNLDGKAVIRGADGGIRVYLPWDLDVRAAVSWARGDGPNPVAAMSPDQPARMPLSRIPPLNGSAELGWRPAFGFFAIGSVRWALLQDRLALQDTDDRRIPRGGTPGFVVFDLRAGYRLEPWMLLSVVLENVGDAAYRYHGSSVNGAGRGLLVEAQFGF